jgi:hypothetical protein
VIPEGFFVISIFHETKIPTVDMKVQVYSKFRKNKIRKKVKSLMSMTNGRFNTSKCRGMLQKMGVLYTHSPQMPRPSPNLLKIPKKKSKKSKSSNTMSDYGNVKLRPAGDRWLPAGPARVP